MDYQIIFNGNSMSFPNKYDKFFLSGTLIMFLSIIINTILLIFNNLSILPFIILFIGIGIMFYGLIAGFYKGD